MRKTDRFKEKFNRYNVFIAMMLIIFAAITGRLFYLQIMNCEGYKNIANNKGYRLMPILAPRGCITDKNGIKLATDVQSFNIDYTNTDENNKKLFSTLKEVFQILDENKESQKDSFALQINPYRFEFSTNNPKSVQSLQLRFLKDRNFQDSILRKEFNGKKEKDLTSSEISELNKELLKLTPEQVFNKLANNYGIIKGLKSAGVPLTPENIRRYLLVKDEIKMNSFSCYKPITIASNIKKRTALILYQILAELPGINIDNQPLRQYPYGQLASAVLGHMSKISPDDAKKYSQKGYDANSDLIGASGIEAAMESELRGENGGKYVIVDGQGKILKRLGTKETTSGNNVKLTLDANLQYVTEQSLTNEFKYLQSLGQVQDQTTANANRGAAVVLDVHTGGVLSLASLPGFNPNDFSNPSGLTEEQNKKYFNPDYESMGKEMGLSQSQIDYRFPIDTSIKDNTTIRTDLYDFSQKFLYNYATMSLIPSGSTFKPLVAIAGLESGVINPYFTCNDPGYFDIGGGIIDEFRSDGPHGVVGIERAITVSSNPFFMTVGGLLKSKYGNDALAKYAWQFGLGADPKTKDKNAASTGIEISENFGQVYNSYSQKNKSAVQYLLNIEQDLKNGLSGTGTKLPLIDLYDRESDSTITFNGKKLSEIKAEIKNSIKDTVKNGTFSEGNYKTLFRELINADPKYKKSDITDAQLKSIISDIRYQALQNGHGSLDLPYNMYFASIGQGMNNFTPLQLASYISTIANGGTRYKIHLVDKVTNSSGKVLLQKNPTVIDKVDMSPETRQIVMAGMEGVTGAGGADGTAAQAFVDFPIKTGGKTGTAQFNSNVQNQVGRSDYAYYVGYAPADNPQIAVAVVIFDGGYGSYAAEVARNIYEGYFKDQLQKLNYKFNVNLNMKPVN